MFEELARRLVAGVVLEPRIVHLPHLGVLGQRPRHAQGACRLALHAQYQRLHAAFEQEGGVRVERTAHMIEHVQNALHMGARAGDRARDDVAMAVQILRRAVNDDIDAEVRGPEIDR